MAPKPEPPEPVAGILAPLAPLLPPPLVPPLAPPLAQARELILRFGSNPTAYQILNPGIRRWFSAKGDAVVGYVEAAGHWVVAGSPVCSPERLAAVVEEFEGAAREEGRPICYFGADSPLAAVLASRGPWDRLYLGAQPSWDPRRWPAILEGKASLRAQLHRARNKGVIVVPWSPGQAQDHPALQALLEEWLASRGLPSLHFLVEPQTLGRLFDRRIFVAEKQGRPVGFLVATPVPRRRGFLIEQNIRGVEAPNGTTELLLDAAMRALAADGAAYVTLGLCPLSTRAPGASPPQALWIRFLTGWMRAHGRRFYNFEGLDAYKAKFQPERWENLYAITNERRIGWRTLWAITAAFSRSSPLLFGLRAVGRASLQEVRWLCRRLLPSRPSPEASREDVGGC